MPVRARSDAGSEIAESWSQTDLAGHFGDLEPTVACLKSADIGMRRKGGAWSFTYVVVGDSLAAQCPWKLELRPQPCSSG